MFSNPASTAVSKGAVVLACIDLADRNADLAEGLLERLGKRLVFVIQNALCRDIVEVQRVRISLIWKCLHRDGTR
jgi:hypothetical protein